jgi:tRNA(adenine34) deaminase
MMSTDAYYMEQALAEAARAAALGEVPVGAVLVQGGEIIAVGHNRRERDTDPTAHAELLVLRAAAQRLAAWRLTGATLYVTLEPCAMCAGAAVLARIQRLVYGCRDPRAGACESVFQITSDARLNHRVAVTGGVLETACQIRLREFFEARRRSAPPIGFPR